MNLLFVLWIFVVTNSVNCLIDSNSITVNNVELPINDIVDLELGKLRITLTQPEYNPYILPNVNENYQFLKFVTINLNLTNGKMNDMQTIVRNGNTNVDIGFTKLRLSIPLRFVNLRFKYEYYDISYLNAHKTGLISGNISNIDFFVDATYEIFKKHITLNNLTITNQGQVDITTTGNLVDVLVDFLLKAFENRPHKAIMNLINEVIAAHIDEINKRLPQLD